LGYGIASHVDDLWHEGSPTNRENVTLSGQAYACCGTGWVPLRLIASSDIRPGKLRADAGRLAI